MKSNFKGFFKPGAIGLALLAAAGWLAGSGCQNGAPPFNAYPAFQSQVNRALVTDFEGSPNSPVSVAAGSASIYSSLFEANNPPTYDLRTPGTVLLVNNFPGNVTNTSSAVTGPGANGSPYAFHATGTLTDHGDNTFPSLDVQAQMESGSFYDASFFNGIQFYMKIASDDTATHRLFEIPVYQTQGGVGGGCTASHSLCYDHFAANVTAGTGGQWKFFSYKFSDLTQLVPGEIPNPSTLSGLNLQQILWLQWDESLNNHAGTCLVDIWVDDIEFTK